MPTNKDIKEEQCICRIQNRYCGIMQVIDERIYGYGSLTECLCTKPCRIIDQLKKKLSK